MKKRYFIIIPAILIILFLLWYFRDIIAYIIIAAVLSLIGQPIVKKLDKIKIGKFKIPHVVNTIISLLVIVTVFLLFIGIFVPILTSQAQAISEIDISAIETSFKEPIQSLEQVLINNEIIGEDETIEGLMTEKFISLLSVANFSDMFNYLLAFTGNVFIGVFAVLFITFFFMKDEHLFHNAIMVVTPTKYQKEINNILKDSKRLLTRYFIGILIQIGIVVTLLTIGNSVIGVKNAFIIGFFGGIMNIVPYVGPIIGTIMGVLLGVTGNLSGEFYTDMLPLMLKITTVFVIVNLIDNIVLQPTIFSSSVKAHPLEIFLIIMIAGSIAGITGMILAIPAYTFIRIIAREFLYKFKLVKSLTKNI